MSKLWNINSPFVEKMTLISNLIALNILWVICSLPIVTLGASTTAMYSVLFAYHRKETDSVIKPFFSAFRKGFRQSTICWLALLILIAVLAFDIIHIIFDPEGFSLLAAPVVIVGILVVIAGSYIFPQIALYQNKLLPIIKNSFLLFLLNPIPSIAIALLNLFPWVLLLCYPQYFWMTLLLWTLIGIAFFAYINSFLLQKIFQKYTPEAE